MMTVEQLEKGKKINEKIKTLNIEVELWKTDFRINEMRITRKEANYPELLRYEKIPLPLVKAWVIYSYQKEIAKLQKEFDNI